MPARGRPAGSMGLPLILSLALFPTRLFAQAAGSQTASWIYPATTAGTVVANNIDTIVFQWESNYENQRLLMWCQKHGIDVGPDVSLGEPDPFTIAEQRNCI